MAASCRYLLRIIIFGLVLCQAVLLSAQEDTTERNNEGVVQIDTSEYMPIFYETALNYNLMIASSRGYVSEIERLIGIGSGCQYRIPGRSYAIDFCSD